MLPFTLDHELRENLEIERMLVELKKPTRKIEESFDAYEFYMKNVGRMMAIQADKMMLDTLNGSATELEMKMKSLQPPVYIDLDCKIV